MGSTERRKIGRLGAQHRCATQVCLQLHQRRVGRCSAVDGKNADLASGVTYRDQEIVYLEGNGLKRGAGHVLQLCPQSQASHEPRGA